MTERLQLARRAAQRARHRATSGRARVQELQSAHRSIRRITNDRIPPPSAFARFGDGSWVVPPARVPRPDRVAVGTGVVVMEHSTLEVLSERKGGRAEAMLVIDDTVILARFNAIMCGIGVSIGERVGSSDCATVSDTWWPGAPFSGLGPNQAPVVIERHAYLGCNSIVGPGVTIGEGAYVGEGAVVVDDVPAYTVVFGNPARVVRAFDPETRAWPAAIAR